MDNNIPYTVNRLMRIEFRAAGERGTVTNMGEFPNADDAQTHRNKCVAAETDPKYTYEVVRISRPAGLATKLRAK